MTTDTEPEPRALADRCTATCRYLTCTGKGDLVRWAHPCRFAPPRPPDPCNVDGCIEPAVDRYLPGPRCEEHRPPARVRVDPPPSVERAPREYGTATDDPLGRHGPLNQYRIPTRLDEVEP